MGRVKTQHEKLKVLNPCLTACKWLLRQGVIIEYRRLDESDKDHQDGSPDIEIRFIKDGLLWLIMCECKRDDGKGHQRKSQKTYQAKYQGLRNVMYIIVENVTQLKNIIEIMTGHFQKKLNGIEF